MDFRKARYIESDSMTEQRRQQNMTNKRRFDDLAIAIDDRLDAMFASIDWDRRRKAETSLVEWVKTYCVPLLLQDAPSEKGYEVLQKMEYALTAHQNYMICMPRGSGKSSFVECATLFALATGIQKYVVCISNNARAANGIMQDIWRAIAETDTPFAQDYPAVVGPFHICNGSFRRRQSYRGVMTDIQKNASNIVLAKLKDDDGNELPTSNSILTCRGISSGLRGMKFGKLRPTLVLLDDLQSSEMAENSTAVEKLLTVIRKDIMPLGGKERLSILQTATPIMPSDAVEQLSNDKSWIVQTYKAIEKFPNDMELWKEYFRLYDAESAMESQHTKSLEFYKANREKMDAGAVLFNDSRYSTKDGHISALQKLLEIQHMIGDAAFQSEFQMKPKAYSFAVDIQPSTVTKKINTFCHNEVPAGFIFVAASTDLNTSYAATTVVTAFKPDMTSIVVHHHIHPCNIDQKLNDTAYSQAIHQLLQQVMEHLVSTGIKIDGWAIDAGGRNWSSVTQFAKYCRKISACAFAGKASHVFNPFVRSRLREAIGKTVLCGDANEHVKAGAGVKYVFFDSDYWKTSVQKAFLAPVMSPGSCSLYNAKSDEHVDFAIQVCNEKLQFIKHMPNGRDQYFFKTKEPHDFLDCMSMCFAVAASQGLSASGASSLDSLKKRPNHRPQHFGKPRVKIV